ncbi:acyl-CoA dehydrogenase family protein [Streptomyces sp. SL13]|uniref:Acyl-CoA dehydrogenase family protein n=1 Tax=Streptantibioticus silvisoli TaxID=2705255 RepID=A0AA90KA93_9ACTN|nr:acyl-CoA dehydrogenase family protein [Streptantibioticus silvisoli]MDI5964645.1 acyl-CoA dehydrogenase family protein [Streptantibioticus silvisoli]MDI5972118.1 acyl-CoA dehydrogenase family protein [Streptantibioticus silvisoli]
MTGSPDLLYSDVEDDLRAAVRDVLADHCPPAAVLARCESAQPYDMALYRRLAADLGLAGLTVPEQAGGQGASARELAVVMEELGRAVAPVPFLGVAMATAVLAVADAPQTLKRIAAGELPAAVAVPLTTTPGAAFPAAVRAGADGALTGRVTSVADVSADGVLLVPATGPDGPGLFEVPVGAAGVRVEPVVSLDLTRPVAHVVFDGAAGRAVAGAGTAARALEAGLLAGAGLLASEQLGVAERCLEMTVAYLGERRQFARVVGSFQAVKHRLADLWQEVVSARAAARAAADALAVSSPDAPVAVSVAQAYCSRVAVHAAEECVQLHGGIGMTWEHPAHLYLKRAKADELALGTPGRHRALLAAAVRLPPPAPES